MFHATCFTHHVSRMNPSLHHYFTQISRPRILVLGDPILDHYVWGDTHRISPEAPIPVLKQEGEEYKPGGAGSVCCNLQQLEAEVAFCGVVGDDLEATLLRDLLEAFEVDLGGLMTEEGRVTSRKTRFMARVQQVLRVDREVTDSISSESEGKLRAWLEEEIPEADLLVVSDYGKGVATPALMHFVAEQCRAAEIPCIADPAKLSDYSKYRDFTIISPNRAEAEIASGVSISDDESLARAAQKLLEDIHLQYIAITRDRHGISLFENDGSVFHEPAHVHDVYDVTGAGDMVTSVLSLVLADGGAMEDAIRLANVAAGIEVTKLGVAPVTREEICETLLRQDSSSKLKSVETLLQLLGQLRVAGRKIVFTNGCFDILHQGHIYLLQSAKAFGDILIVGMNSDASVRRLKGPQRPILSEEERALLLSAIGEVDFVVVFEEDTPVPILKRIQPDVLVKGTDYSKDQVVGHEFVEAYGGEVQLVPIVDGISTTDIVTRILERHQ